MAKIKLIKFKKIKAFLIKLPKAMALHSFLTFLVFLLLALVLGALIFYQTDLLIKKEDFQATGRTLEFNEKNFKKVVKILGEKEEKFNSADAKEYLNPFHPGGEKTTPETGSPKEGAELKFSAEIVDLLLKTKTLFDFYAIKGEWLPSIPERSLIWEEKGLGLAGEYFGLRSQNDKLLNELKEELTK